MATITETEARVEVRLRRELFRPEEGASSVVDRVAIVATSHDANGNQVRALRVADLLPNLSPTRQAQVAAILDDAIAYVRNQFGI